MRKNPYHFLLLLLAAYALRIYRVPQLSLRADEAATVFEASAPWDKLFHALSGPNPSQPLYYLLLHGWMGLAGSGELAVRYLTIMSGVLLVPLVYVLGRRLFPDKAAAVGLWAASLAAINPLLIWDAQDNRMYPLLAVLNLASVLFCLALLEGRGGWASWFGYVLSTALALYTHYLAFFILLTENALWACLSWRVPQRIPRIRRWIAAELTVAMLFAPWVLKSVSTVSSFTTDFLPPVTLGEMLRRILVGLSLGYSVEARSGTILALGFCATALLGLLTLGEGRRHRNGNGPLPSRPAAPGRFTEAQSVLALLIYLIVPLVCIAAFSILRFPIFDERYLMLSLPAYLLILGHGLSNLSSAGPRRWLATIGLIGILIASGVSLRNYYFVPHYMKGIDWRSYVARLLECAKPGEILVQNYPDQGLTYHLRDQMPRVLLPAKVPVNVEATERKLQRLSKAYSGIWLQPQTYERWDAEGLVETWLDRHTLKVGEEPFGNVRLVLYLPVDSRQRVMRPLDAVLGDRVRLLGFMVQQEAVGTGFAPSQAQDRCLNDPMRAADKTSFKPGSGLQLTLFWQPQSQIAESYTVFTHLYDASDRIWSQQDSPPLGGTYPTSQWQVGETIADRYELPLDPEMPAGDYRLMVGMYDPTTGERLPAKVRDEKDNLLNGNRILLTTVRVER